MNELENYLSEIREKKRLYMFKVP